MITTLKEIEQRFDAIKDHKPKASKKLNELGEILASAYKIESDRADEMWQYLIDLNVREDVKNAKFYIAQVFNKIRGFISEEEATDLIMMTPERVELMLLYGYDGGTLYSVLSTLTISFLKNEDVNDTMASLEYAFEKFGGVDSGNPEILKATKTIVQTGAELLRTNNDYEQIVRELLYEIENLDNDKIAAYGKVNGMLLGLSEEQDIEEVLGLANEYEFTQEFLDLLWLGKEKLSSEKLEAIWQDLAENLSQDDLLPAPQDYEEDVEYADSKMRFYVKLVKANDQLLAKYFENNKDMLLKQCIIYEWIQTGDWDRIAEYIAKNLMVFEDENGNLFDYGFMGMINPFMKGYLMVEYMDQTDKWGRSIKIVNDDNLDYFINALCKASAMSVGCEFHEQYHSRIKEFVEKATGNMDVFEKYGFTEKIDERTGIERLQAFARDFIRSGAKEIDFRMLSHKLKTITDKIQDDNRALDEPQDIDYILACDDDIIEFYYKHTRQDSWNKGKMLAACIKHGNIQRALEILDLLKETQKYDDYNDLNGWGKQFGLTIEYCIKEFDTERYSWKKDEITSGMIEECKQIANMSFDYLSEESVSRIKAEIRRICPEEEGAEEYIQKLLDEVKIYCTFPKPRGKGGATNINRMSDEIWKSFKILSKMGRIDIVCQIMEQFANIKDILKPVTYDTWMSAMNGEIRSVDCVKVFRKSKLIYESWLGGNAREYDIKMMAGKIKEYGTNEEYEEFKRMVFSRCGVIEGLDEYCENDITKAIIRSK